MIVDYITLDNELTFEVYKDLFYSRQEMNTFDLNSLLNNIADIKFYKDKTTVIFWQDHTKTVSVCNSNDKFDPFTGICLCILKKINNHNGNFAKKILKLLEEYYGTY